MKPIIGISGNWAPFEKGRNAIPDKTFSYLLDDYSEAVVRAGGIPWVIPVLEDVSFVDNFLERIDGLIMSGGGDIHPDMWGADHYSDHNMYVRPKRDRFEWELFLRSRHPVLGICRGHQLIALALGGDMYQDLSEIDGDVFDHRKRPEGYLPMHEIVVEQGSILESALGTELYRANSSHHQIIKRLPEGFRETGKCKFDSMNEAFEGQRNGWDILSVQWHPEAMPEDRGSRGIFTWIVEQAKKRREYVKSREDDTENPRHYPEHP